MSYLYISYLPQETPQSFCPVPESFGSTHLHEASFLNYRNIVSLCVLSQFLSMFYVFFYRKKHTRFDITFSYLFWLVDLVVSCRFFTHQ